MNLFGIELNPFFLFAQAIGVAAATFGILSFQQKKQAEIVFFQVVNHVLWVLHMFLLGAIAGALMNFIGVVRGIVYYFRSTKKWAQSPLWVPFFCALIVGASVFAWVQGDGWIAMLPLVSMLCTTFSLRMINPFHVRALSFFSSPGWCVYNIIKGSIPGVLTELFLMGSICIGILRLDLKKKPREPLPTNKE